MFQIFVGTNYDFMGKRKMAFVVSGLLILAGVVSLAMHGGPRRSIDFTGGTVLMVRFSESVDVTTVRSATEQAGLSGAEIQMVEGGREAMVRVKPENTPENAFLALESAMETGSLQVELLKTDTVGPKVGDELAKKATQAILWAMVLMLIYIAWRFRRFSFGVAAVIALLHDIVIVLGIFSLLNREISLTIVAALLTIGGYSINDTIVLFDRIRENRGMLKRKTFQEVVNISVNQTLSRTVLTSLTTLVAILALYLFGGLVLRDFALAMLIGVAIGTYSSIFVASSLAVNINSWWIRRKESKGDKSGKKSKKKGQPALAG